MRRRTFLTLGNEGIDVSKAVASDVCLYNKTTQKLLIVEASKFTASEYPSSKYSPVGVVVIPGSHNVYGDGSCGVVSLKEMNYNTPDSGSSSNFLNMHFGSDGTDISNLKNYNVVCYVSNGITINKTVKGKTAQCYLPSDKFFSFQNPYDKDTYYYGSSTNYYYAPSPYNEDDTRNTAYYQTSSPSSTSNCLSDFDGVGNTEILCSLATAQSDWKTANKITNNSGSGYYPAACCCWRYHTEGTKQGDWYLPAAGELGYMMVKVNKINETLNLLTSSYDTIININIYSSYWTSTEDSSSCARRLNTENGLMGYHYRNSNFGYVRAFMRVK